MTEEVVWQIVFTVKETVSDDDLEASGAGSIREYCMMGEDEHPLDLLESLMAMSEDVVTWKAYTTSETV